MASRGSVQLVGLGDFQRQFDWAHHGHITLDEVLNRCYLHQVLIFFSFTITEIMLTLIFVLFGSLVRQVKVGKRFMVVCCAHFFVIDSVSVEGCGALIVPGHLELLLVLVGGIFGGKEELILVLFCGTVITGLVRG